MVRLALRGRLSGFDWLTKAFFIKEIFLHGAHENRHFLTTAWFCLTPRSLIFQDLFCNYSVSLKIYLFCQWSHGPCLMLKLAGLYDRIKLNLKCMILRGKPITLNFPILVMLTVLQRIQESVIYPFHLLDLMFQVFYLIFNQSSFQLIALAQPTSHHFQK